MAGIDGRRALLSVLGNPAGIAAGDAVVLDPGGRRTVLGTALLGRAVDGLGRPLDGGLPPAGPRYAIPAVAPALQDRRLGTSPLWTRVRAIDGLLTISFERVSGSQGPPGCGKSVLLERIAAGIDADAVVVARGGERASEARRRLAWTDAVLRWSARRPTVARPNGSRRESSPWRRPSGCGRVVSTWR